MPSELISACSTPGALFAFSSTHGNEDQPDAQERKHEQDALTFLSYPCAQLPLHLRDQSIALQLLRPGLSKAKDSASTIGLNKHR